MSEFQIKLKSEDIINIQEGLVKRILELDSLIINNKEQGYPTNIYEENRNNCIETYKKISDLKVIINEGR
jgi:hypothetical protein